jgi:DNA-binding response OmpR family regulator
MQATRLIPAALAELTNPPAFIVFVGLRVVDLTIVEEFVSAGAVVLVAARAELVQQWLRGQLPEPVVLRRESAPVIRAGDLTVDLQQHRASWRGRPLSLSERELALLAALAVEPGKALSFRELFQQAWPGERYGDAALIKVAVRRLRRKLKEAGVLMQIESAPGFGFRLITA